MTILAALDGMPHEGYVPACHAEEAFRQLDGSSILLYLVVLPPNDAPASGTPWQMMQLAIDTGGKTVAVRHASDLTTVYEQIGADVRNLHRVGYVPSPLVRDGTWHQIQVRAVRSGDYALLPSEMLRRKA